MKQIGAVVLVWLLALGMIGCQVASAPTDVTDEALPAVTTEATEPEATRFVSTSRYQPTLPTEAPKPTQATEETGATQPTEVEGDASSYTPAPTEAPASTEAPPPAATEPPATEPPVTEAPATEAPAVSLDYSTAASYGNSYMASTYGCIVDYDVEGYYPAAIRSLDYYASNGGQAALNQDVATCVDLTYYDVGCVAFNGGCSVYENNGNVYIIVYYG